MNTDKLVLRCIVAAMVYFVLGTGLGVFLVLWPEWPGVMRTVHTHINLAGWVTMVVYAAGYGALPRITGKPLFDAKTANVQFWLANGALVALTLFWMLAAFQEHGTLMFSLFYACVAISAVLLALSAFLFILIMFKTLKQ